VFGTGVDGVRLTRDNEISGLRIYADPDRRAVFNDTAVQTLGTIRLGGLIVTGQVQIVARGQVRAGHVVGRGSGHRRRRRP
jgi:hypothetical protein